MNGIDAARAIRKLEHAVSIPILCVTAYSKQIQEETAVVEFADVIAKPIDFDSLPAVINRYLEQVDCAEKPDL